jgi:hypothetical protein
VAPLRPLRLISLLVVPLSVWLGAARPSFGAAKDDDASPSTKDDASEDSDAPKQKPAAESEKTDATKAEANDTSYGHVGQFGLRAGLVVGYRMILRYSDSPFCATPDGGPADSQQTFCGHGAPLATDLALSFGVLDFLEPFVWARLGFGPERQTDTNPLRVLGAGVRLYTMSDAAFKIFVEPAVGVELEGGRGTPAWQLNSPQYKKDFVFKIAAGPQYDFARYVGIYVTGGVSAAFVRALGASLDLGFGVQGRLP